MTVDVNVKRTCAFGNPDEVFSWYGACSHFCMLEGIRKPTSTGKVQRQSQNENFMDTWLNGRPKSSKPPTTTLRPSNTVISGRIVAENDNNHLDDDDDDEDLDTIDDINAFEAQHAITRPLKTLSTG
ncbi:hypothetical protein BDW59DRAFT_165651 [Aspergillus cavernicola]|uniref:Uncharacterized protein n=1 Tax=Aspergillus cavernicola TaxID=176166 RepID=A0ABR4HS70_9EURO